MKNKNIKNISSTLLSDNWYTLKKYTFDYLNNSGEWETQHREAYDRGNGATILLYNVSQKSVILTEQFRLPTFVNGNESGMMIEACAGLLEENNPIDCIKKETEEETGYRIENVRKIMEAYMSPGSVTELIYFFIAEYAKEMKVSDGGGAEDETENIDVLEIDFEEALHRMQTGEIKDGKTIMLLQYLRLHHIL